MNRGRKPEGREMPKELFDELNAVRIIDRKLKMQLLAVERLETILMPKSFDYSKDRVQESHIDNLTEVTISIAKARNKVRKLQGDLLAAIDNNYAWIGRLDNEDQKDVLIDRYINCLSQEKTGVHLSYSLRRVQTIENKGKLALVKVKSVRKKS